VYYVYLTKKKEIHGWIRTLSEIYLIAVAHITSRAVHRTCVLMGVRCPSYGSCTCPVVELMGSMYIWSRYTTGMTCQDPLFNGHLRALYGYSVPRAIINLGARYANKIHNVTVRSVTGDDMAFWLNSYLATLWDRTTKCTPPSALYQGWVSGGFPNH